MNTTFTDSPKNRKLKRKFIHFLSAAISDIGPLSNKLSVSLFHVICARVKVKGMKETVGVLTVLHGL